MDLLLVGTRHEYLFNQALHLHLNYDTYKGKPEMTINIAGSIMSKEALSRVQSENEIALIKSLVILTDIYAENLRTESKGIADLWSSPFVRSMEG